MRSAGPWFLGVRMNRTSQRLVWPVACWLAILVLGGCSRTPSNSLDASRPIPSSTAEAIAGPQTPRSGVHASLRTIDETEFARVLQDQRGKVVLVDFWATWCLPCVELLPHSVELHNKHANQGLAVILVSFDYPEDDRQRVIDLLESKGASFESFISRYGGDAKSLEAFAIEGGAVPNLRLYDRSGKLRKTFATGIMPSESFEAEDVARAVEALLEESPQ